MSHCLPRELGTSQRIQYTELGHLGAFENYGFALDSAARFRVSVKDWQK
jgi:hypothetical protein